MGRMVAGADYLFVVDVGDKSLMWDRYLASFPAGTNGLFRERTSHDCSACRSFVKQFGNVVSIADGNLTTIWDFDAGEYQPIADAMSDYVKSFPVGNVLVTGQLVYGVDSNVETLEDKSTLRWHHFHVVLPAKFSAGGRRETFGTLQSQYMATAQVLQRSLLEITEDAVLTVLELIASNSLYKGEEWKAVLGRFLALHRAYPRSNAQASLWVWEQSVKVGPVIGRIKNHSIGVLLQDISGGMELDKAVSRYEAIVAPQNYKRPKAIFTKRMVEDAKAAITEMGLADSLARRYANIDDITVNNILFANRDAVQRMATPGDAFDRLSATLPTNPKAFAKLDEVPLATFLKDVLPTARNVELLLEGEHIRKMVSLVAPVVADSRPLFKWGNNFAWAYTGNMTDSVLKHAVKSAGGAVDGALRFSLMWNEGPEWDRNDLDAHCHTPEGEHIYFRRKHDYGSGGVLDVDIIDPSQGKPAVENITWPTLASMPHGIYKFKVHCYSNRGGRCGFKAEVEFNGQIHEFAYDKGMRQGEFVDVAEVRLSKGGFEIVKSLDSKVSSREAWGLKTQQFHPVQVIMHSPNHWDGQGAGNKHLFFMLKGCVNPEQPNGFFNEYLHSDLMAHKRVFEALGSQMRVAPSGDQLSGVGFSLTQRGAVTVKVEGAVSRLLKVVF